MNSSQPHTLLCTSWAHQPTSQPGSPSGPALLAPRRLWRRPIHGADSKEPEKPVLLLRRRPWSHTGPALSSKDSLQHRCPVNGGGPFIVPILQMGEAEVWACTLAPSQLAK